MRQTYRKVVRNVPYWLIIVFSLVAMITDKGEGQRGRSDRDSNPKINIGEFPPNFELPRLVIETDETGKSHGVISETDTVKLSSFRGKKPVCMIMSSYT